MNKIPPLVSIVTPSYNQGEFIEETILSVGNQDYPNIEHLIIDGASNDATIQILKKYEGKYSLKWISEKDAGQTDAVNKGFKMAKGQIIGWLDSDDVYFTRDVISKVVEVFLKNPSVDLVYGDDVFIDSKSNLSRVRDFSNWDYGRILRGYSISAPATFLRSSVIAENKLDCKLDFAMDYEFWLRLGRNHVFKHTRKILAGDRIHRKRKTLVGAEKSKSETRAVMAKYGAKTNLEYYLVHYIIDLPYFQINKILSIVAVLRFLGSQSGPNNLAFNGKYVNTLNLVFKQINTKVSVT
jgi:glycosyltransferase involved in cell wall biosynthesis